MRRDTVSAVLRVENEERKRTEDVVNRVGDESDSDVGENNPVSERVPRLRITNVSDSRERKKERDKLVGPIGKCSS